MEDFQPRARSIHGSFALSLSAMLIMSSFMQLYLLFAYSWRTVALGFSCYIAVINVAKVYDSRCKKRKGAMYDPAVVLNLAQLHKSTFLLLKKHNWLNLFLVSFWIGVYKAIKFSRYKVAN